MAEVFDEYSRRTLLYKVLIGFVVLFALNSFGMIFFLQTGLSGIFGWMFLIDFAIVFIISSIDILSEYVPACKLYIKDSELTISDKAVNIDNRLFALVELKYIEITANNYRGRRSKGGVSDGTGNKILVITQQGEELHRKFVINSAVQWKNLAVTLKLWRQSGFEIIVNGIDLI